MAQYGRAQHEIFESLKMDLFTQKITRYFKMVFIGAFAVFLFFVNTSLNYNLEMILKIILMLLSAGALDFMFKNKVNVGDLQARLFLVTMSSNLAYLNDEYLKNKESEKSNE
jgi:hypothetical protein